MECGKAWDIESLGHYSTVLAETIHEVWHWLIGQDTGVTLLFRLELVVRQLQFRKEKTGIIN
jgi:hypothetical protein